MHATGNDMSDPNEPAAARLALALGGGGARGLAHVVILEALDELGIKPRVIAGTSIGALIGAAYAAGMSGAEIRAHCTDLFEKRIEVVRRFFSRWEGNLAELWGSVTPPVAAGDKLLRALLPASVPATFEELAIPLIVVTTDFYAQEQHVIGSGSLIEALAASSALPSIMRPIELDGRTLIDGGFVNPLPFDLVKNGGDIVAAVDVSAGAQESRGKRPNLIEFIIGATQITLRSIIREKLGAGAPDILIRPNVGAFRVLDFYKFEDIFTASADSKEAFKRAIADRLESKDQ